MFKIPEKQRLVLLVSLVLVTGFLATSLASYYVSKSAMHDSIVQQALPLTSDNIYSEIQRDLLRPVFISSMMAHDTFLRDWALRGEKDVNAVTRYLAEIMQKYGTFTSFFISEKTRIYYHANGILKKVHYGVPIDMWYFRVREMSQDYEINVDPDEIIPGIMTIYINYRMFDYRGNYIGATGVGLSMDHVRNLIAQYRGRYHRNVFFVDRKGSLMLTGTQASATTWNLLKESGYSGIAQELLTADSGSYQFRRGNETVLLNSRFIPELQWYLLVEQAEDPLLAGMRKTLYLNLAVGLLIAGGVLAATRFTVNRYQDRVDARTEELRVSKEIAENATKVKDSYVSLVSHNLRGPLATVKGYLQIALQEKNPDGSFNPAIEEWMQHSHNIAEELIEATAKILDVSRLQTGKIVLFRTCFRAGFLAQQKITQTAHLAAKKRIAVTNDIPDHLRIAGDSDLIGEALLNLLTNSIKFTKEWGSVSIFSPSPNVIAIRDTGVGIHPALLPGLFKHTEMTTTRGTAGEGGTGLGLPYSYDIMKTHGGTLTVQSEEGKGSTFSLVFSETPPALLLVDGNAGRRAAMEKLAGEMFGVEIRTAADEVQARESIAATPPFMVAVGVDGHGVDGLALVKGIRATYSAEALPVAIYSPVAIDRDEEYAALDVNEIILKTPAVEDVTSRLRRYFP